ncbi:phage receptor [Pseudomonas sp. 148P]|uniref:Phage receptor n=1 Tax=Pseudomonas ulcerans TaxID=3115852 RepID=A0ABU7HR90_9PSED|nr:MULTISPECIES: phage receptor [unclassified Pseudomonas]MEE1923075.1 phage receptor [Pseudomonas sp. 147P]MEE1934037.1 phage receptor [Pseudomonas sp. 148P]
MSTRLPLAATSLLLCLSGLQAVAAPMTDFERFRSYPYMDRSYREAKKDNWAEVERLTRYLLDRVPNNDEARALLIQAIAHQGRYQEAEAMAEAQGQDSDVLLELRLARIEEDPPAADVVERWMNASQINQRIRLRQAYSLSLGKHYGPQRALDWLNQLRPGHDDNILRQSRATWAEQVGDWDETVQQLAPLAASGQLGADDWQRLANAYVQRLDDAPLQALLKQAPSEDAARKTRLAMLDRAVSMGHEQQARRWLQSLPEADRDQPQHREQLLELARQSEDGALVQELSNDLGKSCLDTAEWLSRNAPEHALEQLRECRAEDDPKTWLILAQRLHAADLLQNQRLPAPWDALRQQRLLEVWREEGRDDLVMAWLAAQPQTPAILQQRAELLQRSGRGSDASAAWERLYRQTGSLTALDQATYLMLKAGRNDAARGLLEQAWDRHQGRLSASLLQRLAGLYSQTDAPLDARRISGLVPRVDAASRALLLARLAEAGQCDAVRAAIPGEPEEIGQLRALGRCAMPERPGEAVVYYQAAERLGDRSSRLPLAYALEAAGDSTGATRIFDTLPATEWTDNARLTAARSALNAGNAERAEQHWQAAGHPAADDWALGASIAQRRGDLPLALERQRQALQRQPRAGHYYDASILAQRNGDLAQSSAWLGEAVRLAPDNPRYRADYGMRLAGSQDKKQRRQSIAYLERATRDFPEDYRLGETLAWRYDEVENSAAARQELRRVLDVEQDLVDGDDEYGSLEARKYRQRRAHEALSRRDTVTLTSTWSPAGTSTNDTFRNERIDSQRRARSQNVQMAMWDHALGEEPSRNGSTLSVYGRVLFGAGGRSDYAQSMGTGVGLRYKPLGQANLNLYAELYHQRQIDDAHYDGLSLGQLFSPGKVGGNWRDLRSHAQSSNDLLLRATASFFDQGDYRADWRVDEDDWNERFLYLDAAWWTRAGDHQWLSRYQQGHTWKLDTRSPQTVMPYGFLEFGSQDPGNDWRQDLRAGVGLRWQWWFDDDRYNAYRGSLKVRSEYQQSLGGNLYERANGVLLGVELTF